MIPGYNHNVQYKNRIYHIQTEDSGVQNPHIITLLYYGGNILSRKKTSYEDILKSEKLNQVVKEMMQEQHKSMLKDLKNGLMDERISFMLDGAQPAAQPEAPAPTPQPRAAPPTAAAPRPPAPAAQRPAPPQATRPAPVGAKPAAPGAAVPPRPGAPQPPRPGASVPPRPGAPAAPPRPAPPRAAPPPTAQPRPAPPRPAAPLPPPPPPTGKIIELSDDVELKDEDIFGADLISDKSLDEVILNYLAQNIEEE